MKKWNEMKWSVYYILPENTIYCQARSLGQGYGNERKTSPTNHTQLIWLKLWIKEENGVHKVTINLTSHHTGRITIHFVCEAVAYEIEDCRTAELVNIRRMIRGCAVWVNDSYRVMPYKSHTYTGLCRSYKVESNKCCFL